MLLSTELSSRSHFGDEDMSLCDEITKTIHPREGKLPDDSWAFIVNTESHKQWLVLKECQAPEKSKCNFDKNFNPPNGFVTECRQMYTYTSLFAVRKSTPNEEPKAMHFKFPTCCQCLLTKIWWSANCAWLQELYTTYLGSIYSNPYAVSAILNSCTNIRKCIDAALINGLYFRIHVKIVEKSSVYKMLLFLYLMIYFNKL